MSASPGPVLERTFRGHRNAVTSTSFHPSRQQLASGSVDGTVMIWNFKNTMRAFRYVGHRGPVYDVAVSPKGNLVASVSADTTLRLWIPTVKGESSVIKAHTHAIRSVRFSPDAHHIITGSDDKSVKLWNTTTQRFAVSFPGHQNWVRCTGISADGRLCASGGDDKVVHLWDVASRRAAHSLYEHLDSVTALEFHPDGNCIAAGSADQSINLWDLRMVRRHLFQMAGSSNNNNHYLPQAPLLQHYDAHGDTVASLAFHPCGNWLASCSGDGGAKLWDLREGFLYCTINSHEGAVHATAFSDDGARLATAGQDGLLMVWDTSFLDRFRRAGDDGEEEEAAVNKTQKQRKQPQQQQPATIMRDKQQQQQQHQHQQQQQQQKQQQQQQQSSSVAPPPLSAKMFAETAAGTSAAQKANSVPAFQSQSQSGNGNAGLNQSTCHATSSCSSVFSHHQQQSASSRYAHGVEAEQQLEGSREQHSPLLCLDLESPPSTATEAPLQKAATCVPSPSTSHHQTSQETVDDRTNSGVAAAMRSSTSDAVLQASGEMHSLQVRIQRLEALQESLTASVMERDKRLNERLDTMLSRLNVTVDARVSHEMEALSHTLRQQSEVLQSVLQAQQQILAQQHLFESKLNMQQQKNLPE